MAEPERRGAYIKGGEMRVPKTAGEMRREAARKVKAKTASQLKAARSATAPKSKASDVGKPITGGFLKAHATAEPAKTGKIARAQAGDVTKVNPATHKANLRGKAQLAEAVAMPREATATSRERSAAMDDWSHIEKLKRDARFQATQDKGTSRRAQGAKGATKDDWSHIEKLVKDAAYEARKRREAKEK